VRQKPTELGRNWKLVLACTSGVALGAMSIPLYTIGAFVRPLQENFGWSRPEIQTAILFSQLCVGIGAILCGWLLQRFSMRTMAITGLMAIAGGFVMAAMTNGSLAWFYAAYGLAALVGCGSGPVVWSRAITLRFEKQRGVALAIALIGTGIAGLILPPLTVAVIDGAGWRVGYLLLAALPLLIALPAAARYLRGLPKDSPQEPALSDQWGLTPAEALRSYRFWLLLLSVIVLYLSLAGMVPNLIPALEDKGLTAAQAAAAQSSFAATLIVGRLGLGYFLDRFWGPLVAQFTLLPAAVGCVILSGTPGPITAAVAAGMIGLASGAELDLLTYLTARYFGRLHFARIYGLLYFGVAAAAGAGPVAFAFVHDLPGGGQFSFLIAAGFFVIGACSLPLLGRYPTNAVTGATHQ
jgi:MFS transporter, OFA family, oxalate/formate antiporter